MAGRESAAGMVDRMDKLTRLSADDRENLSAYLDGELDDDTTRRIESVLTNSAAARNDVELLQRTYELLELLPRPRAPREFVERTVSTAKLEEFRKPLQQQAWFQQARRIGVLCLWFLALLISGAIGYAATNRWIAREDDLLLKDYPVIQQLDLSSDVHHDADFLKQLAADARVLEELRRSAKP